MLNVGRVSLLGCRRVTLLARVLQLEVVEVLHARLRHACGFLVITLMGCVNTYVPNMQITVNQSDTSRQLVSENSGRMDG